MPDEAHARNAKSRAAQQRKAGKRPLAAPGERPVPSAPSVRRSRHRGATDRHDRHVVLDQVRSLARESIDECGAGQVVDVVERRRELFDRAAEIVASPFDQSVGVEDECVADAVVVHGW